MQIFFPRTKKRELRRTRIFQNVLKSKLFSKSVTTTRTVRFFFLHSSHNAVSYIKKFHPQQRKKRESLMLMVVVFSTLFHLDTTHTKMPTQTDTHTKSHEIRLLLLMLFLGGGRKNPLRKSTASCLNLFSILRTENKQKTLRK